MIGGFIFLLFPTLFISSAFVFLRLLIYVSFILSIFKSPFLANSFIELYNSRATQFTHLNHHSFRIFLSLQKEVLYFLAITPQLQAPNTRQPLSGSMDLPSPDGYFIKMDSHNTSPFVSGFFDLAQCFQGSSMSYVCTSTPFLFMAE